MELAVRTGNLLFEGLTLVSLGVLAAMTDSDDADPALHDALTRLLATRNWVLVWTVMEALALYWARAGRDGTGRRAPRPPRSTTTSATRTSSSNAAKPSPPSEPAATPRTASHDGAALERDQLVAYALDQLADTEP